MFMLSEYQDQSKKVQGYAYTRIDQACNIVKNHEMDEPNDRDCEPQGPDIPCHFLMIDQDYHRKNSQSYRY